MTHACQAPVAGVVARWRHEAPLEVPSHLHSGRDHLHRPLEGLTRFRSAAFAIVLAVALLACASASSTTIRGWTTTTMANAIRKSTTRDTSAEGARSHRSRQMRLGRGRKRTLGASRALHRTRPGAHDRLRGPVLQRVQTDVLRVHRLRRGPRRKPHLERRPGQLLQRPGRTVAAVPGSWQKYISEPLVPEPIIPAIPRTDIR